MIKAAPALSLQTRCLCGASLLSTRRASSAAPVLLGDTQLAEMGMQWRHGLSEFPTRQKLRQNPRKCVGILSATRVHTILRRRNALQSVIASLISGGVQSTSMELTVDSVLLQASFPESNTSSVGPVSSVVFCLQCRRRCMEIPAPGLHFSPQLGHAILRFCVRIGGIFQPIDLSMSALKSDAKLKVA